MQVRSERYGFFTVGVILSESVGDECIRFTRSRSGYCTAIEHGRFVITTGGFIAAVDHKIAIVRNRAIVPQVGRGVVLQSTLHADKQPLVVVGCFRKDTDDARVCPSSVNGPARPFDYLYMVNLLQRHINEIIGNTATGGRVHRETIHQQQDRLWNRRTSRPYPRITGVIGIIGKECARHQVENLYKPCGSGTPNILFTDYINR